MKEFIAVELFYYLFIVYTDILGTMTDYIEPMILIKLLSILLCVWFAFTATGRGDKNKMNRQADSLVMNKMQSCLKFGLLFTCIADYFFLIEQNEWLGVLFFCVVQIIYLYGRRGREAFKILLANCCISFLVWIILPWIGLRQEPLLYFSMIYFILLCSNIAFAYAHMRMYQTKSSRVLAFGMSFFLFCDVNVALFNAAEYMQIPFLLEKAVEASTVFMWFFYVPSQVMIAVSIWYHRKETAAQDEFKIIK